MKNKYSLVFLSTTIVCLVIGVMLKVFRLAISVITQNEISIFAMFLQTILGVAFLTKIFKNRKSFSLHK
jgi:hypothetical protein